MTNIGRNDPCPCGSGKKYKNCCIQKSESISLAKYKYDRYLEIRGNTCGKIIKICFEDLNINPLDPGFYLLDSLLFEPEESKNLRDADAFDNFLKNVSFIFTIYGYPIFEKIFIDKEDIEDIEVENKNYKIGDTKNLKKYLDKKLEGIDAHGFKLKITDIIKKKTVTKETIENNYLWKHCLINYPNKFSQEEKNFLNSIKDSIPGFFKIIDADVQLADNEISGCPILIIEDIFTGTKYKLLDRLLSESVVKHDIFCGILLPYTEIANNTFYVLEGTPPIVYPPIDKQLVVELIKLYSSIFREDYKPLFTRTTNYPEIFKVFPIVLYQVAVDYFYHTVSAPLPKLVNYDKEEIIFSKTIYKIKNREEIKKQLISFKDISIVEETEKEDVFNWLNEKDTILGTIFLNNNELIFEANSIERLERWKQKTKNIPIKFEKTEFTSVEELQKQFSEDNTERNKVKKAKTEKIEIPEEALEEFALKWWENYYNEWINTKIPALGNITPLEAIKTKQGRIDVETLIEDYENHYLHELKRGESSTSIQKYFNPDELRKRLGLI